MLISYLCVIAKAEYALSGNAINRSVNTAARRFVFECRVANVVKQITSGSPSVCVLCERFVHCARAILDPALRRSEASLQRKRCHAENAPRVI